VLILRKRPATESRPSAGSVFHQKQVHGPVGCQIGRRPASLTKTSRTTQGPCLVRRRGSRSATPVSSAGSGSLVRIGAVGTRACRARGNQKSLPSAELAQMLEKTRPPFDSSGVLPCCCVLGMLLARRHLGGAEAPDLSMRCRTRSTVQVSVMTGGVRTEPGGSGTHRHDAGGEAHSTRVPGAVEIAQHLTRWPVGRDR